MNSKSLPKLETIPTLLNFAQTNLGKIAFATLFCAMAFLQGSQDSLIFLTAITLTALFPNYRRPLIAAATAYVLVVAPCFGSYLIWLFDYMKIEDPGMVPVLCTIAFFGLASIGISLSRRYPGHRLFQRPVRNLLLLYTGGIVFVSYFPLQNIYSMIAWTFLIIAGKYIWFIAYSLTDRAKEPKPFTLVELFHFNPFWGGSNVPWPKGEAYLRRIEAKTPLALATVQIKGLKLMVWASILLLGIDVFNQVCHGSPGFLSQYLEDFPAFPQLTQVIKHYLSGTPFPRWECWLVLLLNFIQKILSISSWGAVVIATCRMVGFNALRNTYKPLFATSIADFYNRLYYYFKELLVDFFFYPTYFRFFKKSPRLRIFFATLAAAGFGNALFHFLRDIHLIIHFGFWKALVGFQTYLLYCLILGTAIGLSQIQGLNAAKKNRGILNSIFVLGFYCILMILDDPVRTWGIADYGSFIINLFVPFAR